MNATAYTARGDLHIAAYKAEDIMRRAAHLLDRIGGPNKKAMAQELRAGADRLESERVYVAVRTIRASIAANVVER